MLFLENTCRANYPSVFSQGERTHFTEACWSWRVEESASFSAFAVPRPFSREVEGNIAGDVHENEVLTDVGLILCMPHSFSPWPFGTVRNNLCIQSLSLMSLFKEKLNTGHSWVWKPEIAFLRFHLHLGKNE